MPLTSLSSATDKRAAKTDSHRKKTQHIFNLHIEEEKSYLIGYFVEYKVLGGFFFFAFYCGGLLLMRQFQIRNQVIIYKNINRL